MPGISRTYDFVKKVLKYNLENPLINRSFNTTNSKNLVAYANRFNYIRNSNDKIPLKYGPISYSYIN